LFRSEPIWLRLRRKFLGNGNWEGAVLSKTHGGFSRVIFYRPSALGADHECDFSAEEVDQYRIADPLAATRARWHGDPADEPATEPVDQSSGRPYRQCRALAASKLHAFSSDDDDVVDDAECDDDSDVSDSASRSPTAGPNLARCARRKVRLRHHFTLLHCTQPRSTLLDSTRLLSTTTPHYSTSLNST
jgi:hypothetical protein